MEQLRRTFGEVASEHKNNYAVGIFGEVASEHRNNSTELSEVASEQFCGEVRKVRATLNNFTGSSGDGIDDF